MRGPRHGDFTGGSRRVGLVRAGGALNDESHTTRRAMILTYEQDGFFDKSETLNKISEWCSRSSCENNASKDEEILAVYGQTQDRGSAIFHENVHEKILQPIRLPWVILWAELWAATRTITRSKFIKGPHNVNTFSI